MLISLLIAFVFIAIGWVALIRPQQERMREQREMVATLEAGDRVITAGGIHGELVSVAEETVEVEVAPGLVLTLARPAIARRIDESADEAIDEPGDEVGADVDVATNEEPGVDPAGENDR